MQIKNYNTYFFFLLLAAVTVLSFYIIRSFFVGIIIAAVMAVILQKPYNFFLKLTNGKAAFSSFLTAFFGSFFVLVFLFFFSSLLINEVSSSYKSIFSNSSFQQQFVDNAVKSINRNSVVQLIGVNNLISKDLIGKTVSQLSDSVISLIKIVGSGMANAFFFLFIAFFSLYYFLIMGKQLVKKIMSWSPLKNAHESVLINSFVSMSRATIKGALMMGFIQGVIGWIAFMIIGIPSAAVWAFLMMICSIIPVLGTSIVWFPIGIIALITGYTWQGIFILGVGFLVISSIDNFLRPHLVGKDTQMHPLMVLFSTLGGIKLFGFFGFIIGPIVMALFLTLWDIYAIEFKGQLKKYNS